MINVHSFRPSLTRWLLLLILFLPSFSDAADSASALIVNESGAYLYARQDDESSRIARLEKGEELTPLAHVVGTISWYMVKTPKGSIGWVRSSDVTATARAGSVFEETLSASTSTWSAVTRTGRTFGGTWTAQANPSTGDFSGTWTLSDGTGKTVLDGAWSARKFPTGWNGVWRALVTGQNDEYSGTWSADLRLARDGRFAELFEVAVREAVRGIWAAGSYSGSWSIRTAK